MHSIKQNRIGIINQISEYQKKRQKYTTNLVGEITLLAASKTQPIENIIESVHSGQFIFGENYAQEGVNKINIFNACAQNKAILGHNRVQWHFIGPIQSNKTKLIAAHFDWVQSVDHFKIAARLNRQRGECNPLEPLQVLIQINISSEQSKSGLALSDHNQEMLFNLAEQINDLDHLCLRGIMAIPAPQPEYQKQFEACLMMRHYFEQLQQIYPQIDTLSMGMSNDLEAAIMAGATMVRIGTALFGARN